MHTYYNGPAVYKYLRLFIVIIAKSYSNPSIIKTSQEEGEKNWSRDDFLSTQEEFEPGKISTLSRRH